MADAFRIKIRPMYSLNKEDSRYLVLARGNRDAGPVFEEVACNDWDEVVAFLNSLNKPKTEVKKW